MALQCIISGTVSGSDIIPALHGPVSSLLHHGDLNIKALAVQALVALNRYREEENKEEALLMWEQIHNVVNMARKVNGKSKESKDERGEQLELAFLNAARSFHGQGHFPSDKYVCTVFEVDHNNMSSSLTVIAFQHIRQALHGQWSDGTVSALYEWIAKQHESLPQSLPLQLETSRLLGKLQAYGYPPDTRSIQILWQHLTTHLKSKNANRRLFAVQALKALLPFEWYSEEKFAQHDLRLDEGTMESILRLLGDVDPSIRKQALVLLHQIDHSIIEGHVSSLRGALSDERRANQRTQLVIRTLESLSLLLPQRDSSTGKYISDICSLIFSVSDVDSQQIIAQVVSDWENSESPRFLANPLIIKLPRRYHR